MSTSAVAWGFRLMPIVVLLICYFFSQFYLQSKYLPSTKSLCDNWIAQLKWDSLNFNVSRKTELFLKLQDFFWKEHRSELPLPYGVKGSEALLMKVLAHYRIADSRMPTIIDSLECRTCVVIGNGFEIKNSSLGTTINKYDVVIRMNDAPVRGYEHDVGNKTTLRLFYPESASSNPDLHNDPDTLMVLVPFKAEDLNWLKQILYNEKRVRKGFWRSPPQIWLGRPSQLRILDPHFLHLTASKFLEMSLQLKKKHVHPTTGILGIIVALNYCDVVHVAGFGYPDSKNMKDPIHYYGSTTMKSMKDSYHDLNHEAKALKRLEDLEIVTRLHQRS
ncbi:CMP-N-acetylneuraminate-beta-galactosamide-alpha-2,3-sialyltransferase 4 [Hoplias malabaricus]|uniref:CMP-N-acetylneuraminate-beta-galactosamide- alpha-2,3-sialyltransferase 4 n=1 Tax=Hoplias malabaricus TaxID=27720 RepID=UPI00346215F4